METNAATERRHFVRDIASGHWSMSELCDRYRISRPTGYKWVARYESEGEHGLDERSRAPHACPHRTQAVVETLLIAARRQYGWGARKLIRVLAGRYPHLTFASTGLHRLSRLNVWWMQLGIVHQRLTPARPQENGQHERMHRELQRETARPPARNRGAQQHRFDACRRRYNDERPHEGIGDRPPSSLWRPSSRTFPERVFPPAYAAHLEVRRISTAGTFQLRGSQLFLTQVLRGHDFGFEEIDDGIWNIVYYRTLLGRLDERTDAPTSSLQPLASSL